MRPERRQWKIIWQHRKPLRFDAGLSNWRERGSNPPWTFGMIRAGEERR